MRSSLIFVALALIPTAVGVWMVATLPPRSDASIATDQQRSTSTAAADLLVREQAIEARLLVLAADPQVARLSEGRSGPSVPPSDVLSRLRGTDGPILSGACITTSDGRSTVLLEAAASTAGASTCAPQALLDRARRSAAGEVVRMPLRSPSGAGTLLIAAPLAKAEGGAVLAAGIDLAELLRAQPAASGEAPSALIVHEQSAAILATLADPESPKPAQPALPPDQVALLVHGMLSGYPPTADHLAATGWVTAVAPLWPTLDGSELSLIHLWPRPTAPLPVALLIALAVLAAVTVVAAVGFARELDRPFRELSESRARLDVLYREARQDSLHDGLTGMGNHRSFQEELARGLERFERSEVPFALLLIDLDNLKVVNDREGHAEGDRLLTSLAARMREAIRETDRLFRTGGDEFAVIMPGAQAHQAVALATRLQHSCSSPAAGERPVAFSGGISAIPRFTQDIGQLYRQADAALYWAKRHGRGFVEVFDPERDQMPGDTGLMGLEGAIEEVIRLRALTPVFQPIVDLRDGSIVGFEGLVRPAVQNPFPNPEHLWAAASATGRTVELDLAAIEVIAAAAGAISSDLVLSVNLSPRTLEVKDFDSAWLLNTLRQFGIAPERVILELTERDGISDLKRLRQNITLLSEYGFRFAADDLGAGNAGLRLISQLPFDVVKLDLSLVQEAAHNTAIWDVLRSVRELAWRQHALIIGEGVETPEHVGALRQLGIDLGQGYLLGKPLPLSALGPRDRGSLAHGPVTPRQNPGAAEGLETTRDRPHPADGDPERDERPAPTRPASDVPFLRPLQPRAIATGL